MFLEESNQLLNEGTLRLATVGFRIPHKQNLDVSCKKHSYIGLSEFVQKCKRVDELLYVRSEIYSCIKLVDKYADIVDSIAHGKHKYSDRIEKYTYKLLVKKGVTSKDCIGYRDWLKNVLLKEISQKLKELRNN